MENTASAFGKTTRYSPTEPAWPLSAAITRGVLPLWSTESTFPPLASRSCRQSTWSLKAAAWTGVLQFAISDMDVREIFNWASKVIRNCFIFALLRSDWSKKIRATLSTNQMQNQNQSRLGRPRCTALFQFGRFYFDFPLAVKCIFLSFQWPLSLLWSWLYGTLSKSALKAGNTPAIKEYFE